MTHPVEGQQECGWCFGRKTVQTPSTDFTVRCAHCKGTGLEVVSTKPQEGDQGALQAQAPSVTTERTQAAVVDWPAERQLAYWRKGHEIVEGRLAKAVAAKHGDAPFPMDAEQAAAWHSAQADAYRDALEMMGVPECVRLTATAIAKGGAS